MVFFCLLWLPFFYALWTTIKSPVAGPYEFKFYEKICALSIGAAMAILRFFLDGFWNTRGFGISRYIGIFIDWIIVPIVVPLFFCLVFSKGAERMISKNKCGWTPDWTGFVLLALIPSSLICSIQWISDKDPANLILIPLLWTAIAVNLYPITAFLVKKPFFVRWILGGLGIAIIALLAAAVKWAFFCSKTIPAFLFLSFLLVPAILTIVCLYHKCKSSAPEHTNY